MPVLLENGSRACVRVRVIAFILFISLRFYFLFFHIFF